MNISRLKQKVFSHNKLNKLQLGRITASSWLREQLLQEAEGVGAIWMPLKHATRGFYGM